MTPLKSLRMKLAVPYNHDRLLLDGLAPFAEDIAEVYLPVPPDVAPTLRAWGGPPPDEYRRLVPEVCERLASMGIAADLIVNAPSVPFADHARVVAFAMDAVAHGVRVVTVADLHLASAIRGAVPDVEIVASTGANVSHVSRARHWVRQAGTKRVVVARVLNRSPARLAEFRRLGLELEVIVEEGCLAGCPFEQAHYTSLASWTEDGDGLRFRDRCWPLRLAQPWEHYQTEVLPFSVHHLEGLVSMIKVVGRDAPTDAVVEHVRRYVELTADTHLHMHYREPPEVWDRVATCDRVCEECGFCEAAFREANPGWEARARRLVQGSPVGGVGPATGATGRDASPPVREFADFGPSRVLDGFVLDAERCSAVDLGLAEASTGRLVIVARPDRFVLCRSRADAAADADLRGRVHEACQLYLDVPGTAEAGDALSRVRQLRMTATCLGCRWRRTCVTTFEESPDPPLAHDDDDIRRMLADVRGRVLDVGLGGARLGGPLREMAAASTIEYHGLHPDPDSIAAGPAWAGRDALHGMAIEDLPGSLGTFDRVLVLRTLGHVVEIEPAMRGLVAALATGGTLIMAGRATMPLVRSGKAPGRDAGDPLDARPFQAWDSDRVVRLVNGRLPLAVAYHRPVGPDTSVQWLLVLEKTAAAGEGGS